MKESKSRRGEEEKVVSYKRYMNEAEVVTEDPKSKLRMKRHVREIASVLAGQKIEMSFQFIEGATEAATVQFKIVRKNPMVKSRFEDVILDIGIDVVDFDDMVEWMGNIKTAGE